MFGRNIYLDYYPHIPTSLQTRASNSNSVADQNDSEIHLQYHHNMHNNIFPSPYLLPTNGSLVDTAALFNQDANYAWNGDFAAMAGPKKQIATKKDRHSKIYTAQGPRDRRVRLSIDIARKFFDLQEMLGFDKPSKTLDWLLSKSKTAIQELVESKNGNDNKCVSNCSSQEEVLSPSENCNSFEGEDSKGKSIVPNFTAVKEVIVLEKGNLAKESRVKRREKARERTKEKMCIQQLNVARIHQAENRDCPLSSIFGYHQQNGSTSSSNVTENWDYNNFVSQSNQLCNILDPHNYINQ